MWERLAVVTRYEHGDVAATIPLAASACHIVPRSSGGVHKLTTVVTDSATFFGVAMTCPSRADRPTGKSTHGLPVDGARV